MNQQQPRAGVVELVLPGEPVPGGASWPILTGSIVGVLLLTAALCLAVRALNQRDPLATSFRKLARGLGLSRQEVREVRRISAECGIPAAALLLSPHALGRCGGSSGTARALACRLAAAYDRTASGAPPFTAP
jgi:hypothetical protein